MQDLEEQSFRRKTTIDFYSVLHLQRNAVDWIGKVALHRESLLVYLDIFGMPCEKPCEG